MSQEKTDRQPIPTPEPGTADIGVIGMGVMGTNLARNMARHGYKTAIWNIDAARTAQVAQDYADEGTFVPAETLEDFVASLKKPRIAMMMITAGPAVDSVAQQLKPLMEPGDIIVDGGNSFFQDTVRREQELAKDGLHFVGVGISGGEVGALEGPSIMPGGSEESYRRLGPILETIAAHVGDDPMCAWMGENGAGHFVKMVHNGIEYADIEFIAEAYDMMRSLGFTDKEQADVFRHWNTGELESYLIETAAIVLDEVDEKTGKPLLSVIKDRSQMKGTGTWTVQQALEMGVPGTVIAEAVFARSLSSHDDLRAEAQKVLTGPERKAPQGFDKQAFVDDLGKALWAAKVIAYSQGLDQIREAGKVYSWKINMAAIASIWRAGCVIRARLLQRISDEYANNDGMVSLMCAPSVAKELDEYQDAWRRVCQTAIAQGIPVPGFTTALAYYDGARAKSLPANMVQGLRDFFGAHTYERLDMPGHFHTQWSGDHTEVEVPEPAKKAPAADPEKSEHEIKHG